MIPLTGEEKELRYAKQVVVEAVENEMKKDGHMALFGHQFGAFVTQLKTCGAMDGIVDTVMPWYKATQHLTVSGIDDCIRFKTGNVPVVKSNFWKRSIIL